MCRKASVILLFPFSLGVRALSVYIIGQMLLKIQTKK